MTLKYSCFLLLLVSVNLPFTKCECDSFSECFSAFFSDFTAIFENNDNEHITCTESNCSGTLINTFGETDGNEFDNAFKNIESVMYNSSKTYKSYSGNSDVLAFDLSDFLNDHISVDTLNNEANVSQTKKHVAKVYPTTEMASKTILVDTNKNTVFTTRNTTEKTNFNNSTQSYNDKPNVLGNKNTSKINNTSKDLELTNPNSERNAYYINYTKTTTNITQNTKIIKYTENKIKPIGKTISNRNNNLTENYNGTNKIIKEGGHISIDSTTLNPKEVGKINKSNKILTTTETTTIQDKNEIRNNKTLQIKNNSKTTTTIKPEEPINIIRKKVNDVKILTNITQNSKTLKHPDDVMLPNQDLSQKSNKTIINKEITNNNIITEKDKVIADNNNINVNNTTSKSIELNTFNLTNNNKVDSKDNIKNITTLNQHDTLIKHKNDKPLMKTVNNDMTSTNSTILKKYIVTDNHKLNNTSSLLVPKETGTINATYILMNNWNETNSFSHNNTLNIDSIFNLSNYHLVINNHNLTNKFDNNIFVNDSHTSSNIRNEIETIFSNNNSTVVIIKTLEHVFTYNTYNNNTVNITKTNFVNNEFDKKGNENNIDIKNDLDSYLPEYYEDKDDNAKDYLTIDYEELYKDTTNEIVNYVPTESVILQTIQNYGIEQEYNSELVNLFNLRNDDKIDNIVADSSVIIDKVKPSHNTIDNKSNADAGLIKDSVFPWIVAVYLRDMDSNGFNYICDGALLSPMVVLTAAQCVMMHNSSTVKADDLLLVIGKRSLQQFDDNEKTVKVQRIKVHENFTKSIIADNDLAVLYTAEAVMFNERIQAVNIVPENYTGGYKNGYTTGWNGDGSLVPIALKMTNCSSTNNNSLDSVYCTTYNKDVTGCPSVGGVNAVRGPDGSWILQGIHSDEVQPKLSFCSLRNFSYSSVWYHYQWIQDCKTFYI